MPYRLLNNILLNSALLGVYLWTTGCIASSDDPEHEIQARWQRAGLNEVQINILQPIEDVLFVGTTDGIFKQDMAGREWSSVGLSSDTSQIVDIVAWDRQELMVAVTYDEYHPDNIVIYKTGNGGKSWQSFNENFTGEDITNLLTHLALDIDSPDRIFALGGLPVARSTDRGLTWKAVFQTWKLTAFGKFIKIDPSNSNIIWAGGATNFFTPSLVKSVDGGDSWKRIDIIDQGIEATVWDIWIFPNSSDHVLAGIGGIRRSTNGGESWEGVFNQASIYTLTHSARNPETVYASGRNDRGTVFFVRSRDFGDNWEMIEFQDGPTGVFVNDMVSVMIDEQEVLFLGTNQGMFRCSFEE